MLCTKVDTQVVLLLHLGELFNCTEDDNFNNNEIYDHDEYAQDPEVLTG